MRALKNAILLVIIVAVVAMGAWLALRGSGDITPGSERAHLPIPPESLASQIPARVQDWVVDDLVLLYRDGNTYVAYLEGVFSHSCPPVLEPIRTFDQQERFETCHSSASVALMLRGRTVSIGDRHSAWCCRPSSLRMQRFCGKGFRPGGSIGVRSSTGCGRIERFQPYYECLDGTIRFVWRIAR